MKVESADYRLLRSVHAWAQARTVRLAAKHAMEAFRCEWMERSEPEVGDNGVPPCFTTSEPVAEWCDACQSRDPLFHKMVQLKAIERSYLRGLCSLIDRRAKAQGKR